MDEKLSNKKIESNTSFTDIVDVVYLTPENSWFSTTKNGFLTLISTMDVKPEKLFDDESEKSPAPDMPKHGHDGVKGPHGGHGRGRGRKKPAEIRYTDDGKRDYGRVILHRAFPFNRPDSMISVQCEDGFEIGIIKNINDFDADMAKILKENLEKKYYIPEIIRISSARERFGFVYFSCTTNSGDCEFVVRNPFGSIIHVSDKHIYIIDIDGNRYSIPDVMALDRKSYRKIELYI